MEDLKNTLSENAAFYLEQERKITARLAMLPLMLCFSKSPVRSVLVNCEPWSVLNIFGLEI